MNRLSNRSFVIIAATTLVLTACGGTGQEPAGATAANGASSSSPACGHGSAAPAATGSLSVTVNGVVRHAVVRVPADARSGQPIPVLLSFHGAGMDAASQESIDGFSGQPGFIVVYPEGTIVDANSAATHVNGWDSAGKKVDEPAFVAALLDALGNTVCINPSRVFAAGYSNGGMLVTTLACALPGRIARTRPGSGNTRPCAGV